MSWTYPEFLEIASGATGEILWSEIGGIFRARSAGDADGDGFEDIVVAAPNGSTLNQIQVRSTKWGLLWQASGLRNHDYGDSILGDLDVNGDGRPDVLVTTAVSSASSVYVHDHTGQLLYQVPCSVQGRLAESLCSMGDLDGDGCDDFLIGCLDNSGRGVQWLVSGARGTTIRETYGLLPGDHTCEHVSNLGDIDGDGVSDYAAFPYLSAARLIAVAYSGATGAVIRSWTDYANSVVTGEDFDQDGVNDIVTGADWVLDVNNVGRTHCWSGRDGTELWRVTVVPIYPLGVNGHNWMRSSASLGVQPGNPYPVMAWLDPEWRAVGTAWGRIRAFRGAFAGQGPVSGTACTSAGDLPLIGARKLGAGAANTDARVTVAKTHPNALAVLQLAFAPLPSPVDLSAFGFAGCTVYLDPLATALRTTGTQGIDRGYAFVDLGHPLSAAASGTDLVAQWLVYDPASLAYAATRMHALRL